MPLCPPPLLRTARSLFAANGYAATSIDDVVGEAGVTAGALYHHFPNKRELFRAVLEEEWRNAEAAVRAHARSRRMAWSRLEAGCQAALEHCVDPGVHRILFVEAPAVIGYEELLAIEGGHSLDLLNEAIAEAMKEGRLRKRDPTPLAHMVFGAVCELAKLAQGADQTYPALRRELRLFLGSLCDS